jgi:alpha-glucosidase (family GH31 glycosyl hydrolase)
VSESILLSASSRVRVQHWATNALRITHVAPAAVEFPADRPWLPFVFLPRAEVPRDLLGLAVTLQGGCAQVRTPNGAVVVEEARPPELEGQAGSTSARRVRLSLRIAPGEGFYGWGEWFNAFRRERGTVRLRAQESPSVLQGRQTYSTIPFSLSSCGYGFFLLNSHASVWRIDPRHAVLEVEAQGPPADYLVIHGLTFKHILETYTALTGRPPLPPRWAFGLWTTDFPIERQEHILELAREHRRRSIPLMR